MPAQSAKPPSLKLLTLNVNGLNNPAKRKRLFKLLLDRKQFDIVLLQETKHKSAAQGAKWAREGASRGQPWLGPNFWHHASVDHASKGVAILIHNSAPIKDPRVVFCDEGAGRTLAISFSFFDSPFHLINIYAPNEGTQRSLFFSQVLPAAMPALDYQGHVLAAGDFNCVLSDSDHFGIGVGRRAGREALQAWMDIYSISDCHSLLCPNLKAFTRVGKDTTPQQRNTGARLDRWLAHSSVHSWITALKYKHDMAISDHDGVLLTISCPSAPTPGPGSWALPLYLLNDSRFCNRIKTAITSVVQRPDPMSHRQRWEVIKNTVIPLCMEADIEQRRQRAAARKQLAKAVITAADGLQQAPLETVRLEDLNRARAALQEHDKKEVDLQQPGLEAQWQFYGEQPSFAFHQLGHRPPAATDSMIPAVRDSNGVVHSMQDEAQRPQAIEAARQYWQQMFDSEEVDAMAQAILLETVTNRVDPTCAASCDASFTADNLLKALKTCPRGKRPGPDGLPYEFYTTFWSTLGDPLAKAVQEAMDDADSSEPLPASMRRCQVALIFKGGGKEKCDPASYRPISLLSCDYKIAAKSLSLRMAEALNDVIPATQTAFLPDRWIGDNILFHLEEIDYLEGWGRSDAIAGNSQPPGGALLFLDFEKAYDRVDRAWMLRCMQHLGFSQRTTRAVSALLAGTTAQFVLNGWKTDPVPLRRGVHQGSPLSTLLYILQLYPLTAYMEHLASTGIIHPIPLPDGKPGPICQHHADDTTLHVLTLEDGVQAFQTGVGTYCRASGAKSSLAKAEGMTLGAHPDIEGVEPTTGIRFIGRDEWHRHLGIPLGRPHVQAQAAYEVFARILGGVRGAAHHWSRLDLTPLGRMYIAKQDLCARISFHAQFLPCPPSIMTDLKKVVSNFVSKYTTSPDTDIAAPAMTHPAHAITALPWKQGGMAAVDLPIQCNALLARNFGALTDPRKHPWKSIMSHALARATPAKLTIHLALFPAALNHLERVGPRQHGLSPRQMAYLTAMHAVQPFRFMKPQEMGFWSVLTEPVFFNPRIRAVDSQQPITPGAPGMGRALLENNLLTLKDVREFVHVPNSMTHPAYNHVLALLQCMPNEWRTFVLSTERPPCDHFVDSANGTLYVSTRSHPSIEDGAEVYAVMVDGRMRPIQRPLPPAVANLAFTTAALVLFSRRKVKEPVMPGQAHRYIQYLAAQWTEVRFDPRVWGINDKTRIHHYTVKEAATRGKCMQMMRYQRRADDYLPTLGLFPAVWNSPTAQGHAGLAGLEARWQNSFTEVIQQQQQAEGQPPQQQPQEVQQAQQPVVQQSQLPVVDQNQQQHAQHQDQHAAGPSSGRIRRQYAANSPPPWMRASYVFNDQARQEIIQTQQQQQPQGEVGGSQEGRGSQGRRGIQAADPDADIKDVCTPSEDQKQMAESTGLTKAYNRLRLQHLPREARATAWRILHASLYCGAFLCHVLRQRIDIHTACCSSPACNHQPESLTHLFVSCPSIRPAVQWLKRVWEAVQEAPINMETDRFGVAVLTDDHRIWKPKKEHQALWTTLRVCYLHSVWSLRCQLRHQSVHPGAISAGVVVHKTVKMVTDCIKIDWLRTQSDIRLATDICSSWFRGRNPALALEQFTKTWVVGDKICQVQDSQLVIRFSYLFPVEFGI